MTRALLASVLLLIAARPAAGQEIDRLQWRYQSVTWYSRFSLNATLGPVVLGKTAIFGGVYTYQNAKSSSLSAIDLATTGSGPALTRQRSLPVALDLATGKERWRVKAGPEPVVAGDTAFVEDGRRVRALDTSNGKERWSLPLPPGLSYVHSLRGDRLYLLGPSALGSINVKSRAVVWTVPLESSLAAPMTVTDDTLYFTTRDPSAS